MTASAPTPAATRSIVVDYDLPRPPEQVWRALTEPKLLAAWLMENDIAPVVGHRFNFRATPVPGWDGVVHCEVLEVDAPRRLVYSWRGGSDTLTQYGAPLNTVVTWTLAPTATGGTALRLEHAGFTAANEYAFVNMGAGWRGKLAERIDRVLAEHG